MIERGRVGPVARALGFAGLLPQAALLAWMLLDEKEAWILAAIYGLAILSFLGGAWWGIGMNNEDRQPVIITIAVLPSLAVIPLVALTAFTHASGWGLVAIGSTIVITLFVDSWLERIGRAPEGWMRLRAPLSLGLGGLTIIMGVLVGTVVY